MKILTDKTFDDCIAIFWDTDALNRVFVNQEVLKFLLTSLANKVCILPVPICLEFYNSKDGMEKLIIKRMFIKDNEFFFKRMSLKKEELSSQIEDKIIELKKMYVGLSLPGNPSYQDLYLQAQAVLIGGKISILTGNIKDFNSSIFQIDAMVDFECKKKTGERVRLYFVSINEKNYNELISEYNTMEKEAIARLSKGE